MRARADRGRCLVCGDVLSHLQTVVCSPHCRSIHNFGVKACHSQAMKDRLAVMWHAGEKVAVIALELGVSVNVIVSLRRRIPLPARPSPIRPLAAGQEPKRRRVASAPRVTLPQFGPLAQVLRQLPPVRFLAPRKPQQQKAPEPKPERPVREPRLEPARQCAWLDGERPHWRQCEAVAKSDSPYCEHHHAICYIRTPKLAQFRVAA